MTDSQFRRFWNRRRATFRSHPVVQKIRRLERNFRRKRKLRKLSRRDGSWLKQILFSFKIVERSQDRAKGSIEYVAELSLRTFLSSPSRLCFSNDDAPDVSVVLVLYNRCELTLLCLQSLLACTDVRLELIIVDNQSSDFTSSLLGRIDGAKIAQNAENQGYVTAVNQGARLASGKYLLLLNNDTEVTPHAIAVARNLLEEEASIGAVGGRLVLPDGTLQEAGSTVFSDGLTAGFGRGRELEHHECMFRRSVDYCSAAFLLLRTEEFHALGGFDENFSPGYYEEVDLCTRIIKQGQQVAYDPRIVVRHFEYASSRDRDEVTQLISEHRHLFIDKHREWLQSQPSSQSKETIPQRTRSSGKRRILYIDDEVPFPHLGAGLPRASRLLRVLNDTEYDISFYSTRLVVSPSELIQQTYGSTVECVQGQGAFMLPVFLDERTDYYDLVIVSRPHNMEELARYLEDHPNFLRNTKLIYDAEAVVSIREIEYRRLNGETVTSEQQQSLLSEELELLKTADLIWAVSPSEAEQLANAAKNVLVLSHAQELLSDPSRFEAREGFLFVGAVRSIPSPNADSLEWFFNEVYPCLSGRSTDVPTVRIAGNMIEKMLGNCRNYPCELLGFVEDLTPYYQQSRVFLAPTRYAAGIALKILEAASHGVPIVATPILATQLGWTHEEELLVAGSAKEFAAACLRLHDDQELWERLQANALNAVARDYSASTFSRSIHDSLKIVFEKQTTD